MNLQLTLAARYLWGRKLRTFLTTLAIIFGVLVIFGMNILLPTMLEAFQSNLLAASGQVDITVSEKNGDAFDATLLNKVLNVRGVRVAAASLSRTVNIPDGFFGHDVKIGAVTLIGIDPKPAQQLRDYPMKEGRFLKPEEEKAAVIATSLADQIGVKLGDTVRLPTPVGVVKFKIVGLRPARTLPGNEEVLITLPEAQRLLDVGNQINTIEANLDTTDPARREAIQKEIETRLGSNFTLGALSGGSELFASIQAAQSIFNLMGFLALFMGGFIIFNTFRTVVAERRHDIGMLRAVGASRSTIIELFLAEGLLQGITGTALGIGSGYLLGAGLVFMMGAIATQFLHVQLGAPVIDATLVVVTVALGVGVTLLAGILPALSATRVTPLEALRPSVADVENRAIGKGTILGAALIAFAILSLFGGNVGAVALGGLGFLIGLILIAPALIKPMANLLGRFVTLAFARQGTGTLAAGNLTRQPSRAAITASTTMIGLAILVAATGMITSLTGAVNSLTQKTLGSDFLLMPPALGLWGSNVGASAGLADKLRGVYGVKTVSTMRYALSSAAGLVVQKSKSGDTALSILGIDPVAFPEISGLNFTAGDARTAFAALGSERAMIVNGIFASQTGVKVGDIIRLSTPTGQKEYRVVGIASDMLNAKIMTAYISQANIKGDFRKTEDIFIQLSLAPGATPAEVEPRLKAVLTNYPQFKLVAGKAYMDEIMQQIDFAFGIFYVLLAVLAFPSLIAILNTLAIGVIERTREIGMLRAIGATRDQVRRTILAEALLLAATGTAFGLIGGLYLGYVMVLGLNASGIFPIEYSVPFVGIVTATAAGLLFGVIAALLPARQAAHMEIVQALRYE